MTEMKETIDSVLEAIETGEFDEVLDVLAGAVRARRSTLKSQKRATMRETLKKGDLVVLTEPIRPKYVIGRVVTVIRVNGKTAVVKADEVGSRFASNRGNECRVPLSCIEPAPAGAVPQKTEPRGRVPRRLPETEQEVMNELSRLLNGR